MGCLVPFELFDLEFAGELLTEVRRLLGDVVEDGGDMGDRWSGLRLPSDSSLGRLDGGVGGRPKGDV
jgi:hypothetical protein